MLLKKETTAKLMQQPAAAPKVLFQQEKFYRGNIKFANA
jgi:hypothetical protein